jgi:hypothetical protein
MFVSYFSNLILCLFHIFLISYYVCFIFCSIHFNIDVLTCSFYYNRMSKKLKSVLAKSFHKKSKDGNTEGLFQGSSSSSSSHKALMSVVEMGVQAENPGCAVAFMEEVII